ncbi:MAG: hypothetical protein JRN52_09370 [Nitrososphaerota archaeon]|nr:hypothetical protein [Nitrososphaerota archaeon]
MKKSVLAVIIAVVLLSSMAVSYYVLSGPQTEPFALTVVPEQIRGDALAGQYLVFLVTVSDNSSVQSLSGITLSASANDSAILVQPSVIS